MSPASRPNIAGLGTVYECPDCETRYLDERRCPDCGLFGHRIGAGGNCPVCEEPVAFTDLSAAGEVSPMT